MEKVGRAGKIGKGGRGRRGGGKSLFGGRARMGEGGDAEVGRKGGGRPLINTNPPSHLSTPAHATMTPLSTHQRGGGSTSESPSREHTSCSCCLLHRV